MENEVIFGSDERIREVMDGLAGTKNQVAIVTTCVPAILGEDIRSMLASHDVILVDSPGFSGDVEIGYKKALEILAPEVNPATPGVNIDGACLFDPFLRGNLLEVRRLLHRASVSVGTVFCADTLGSVKNAAAYTLGTNEDFPSGVGDYIGGMLGFDAISETFGTIGRIFDEADVEPVLDEAVIEEERVVRACDKFLMRADPPGVAIFGGSSYALFAARTLQRYLDAEITCIGTRNEPTATSFPITRVTGLNEVKELIKKHDPDLVLGSSFEHSVARDRGFIGLTPPIRGKVRLAPHAIAGIAGTLSFIEDVLNECLDTKKNPPRKFPDRD
jgi:nitrogenase molybdenum-iron protein alpha/beta subunit